MTKLLKLSALLALLAAAPAQAGASASESSLKAPGQDDRIGSDAAFAKLARTEAGGRFLELPRVMFAIDRNGAHPRVHWIDTRRYLYHFDYLQARYLTLADSDSFNKANYSRGDRRFVLGAVVRYSLLDRYGVELWEGDVIEPQLLAATIQHLQAGFHAPLTFKPNSEQQRQAAKTAGLDTISIEQAYGAREQLVMNGGRAVGRLVLVDEGREEDLLPGDIALLKATPVRLPPVAGIVSATFATPINHVSLLAKTWGIPNVYRADADRLWGDLKGRQVVLDTSGAAVGLRLASAAEIRAAQRSRTARSVRAPRSDITYSGLPALAEQDRRWAPRTGAKAANLGEVSALAGPGGAGFVVPPGFSVPFAFYDRFVAENRLGTAIDAVLNDARRTDPAWRRDALANLRARFATGNIPAADRRDPRAPPNAAG